MYTALKALYIHFVSGVIILNASVSYPFEKSDAKLRHKRASQTPLSTKPFLHRG